MIAQDRDSTMPVEIRLATADEQGAAAEIAVAAFEALGALLVPEERSRLADRVRAHPRPREVVAHDNWLAQGKDTAAPGAH